MTSFILASILLPFLGGALVLVISRDWIKRFSSAVALLAALSSLAVLVIFTADGKTAGPADLMYLGQYLVFGVVIDRLSVLIGFAVIFVGFLIVVYSTGYLTPENREHPEKDIERRY